MGLLQAVQDKSGSPSQTSYSIKDRQLPIPPQLFLLPTVPFLYNQRVQPLASGASEVPPWPSPARLPPDVKEKQEEKKEEPIDQSSDSEDDATLTNSSDTGNSNDNNVVEDQTFNCKEETLVWHTNLSDDNISIDNTGVITHILDWGLSQPSARPCHRLGLCPLAKLGEYLVLPGRGTLLTSTGRCLPSHHHCVSELLLSR